MHATLTFALRAAQKAGDNLKFIRSELPKRLENGQTAESFISWAMQKGSEQVAKILSEAYPEHGIYSVQSGEIQEASGRAKQAQIQWTINLISGEHNFVAGLPEVAVYVYQSINGRTEHSAIVFPFLEQSYTASRGQGAQINEAKLKQVDAKEKFNALNVASGFLSSPAVAELAMKLTQGNHTVRISGSSVLDVCRVAAEQCDLAFADSFTEEDFAALGLIITESGALSGDFKGAPVAKKGQLVVANKRLFKQFVSFARA